MKFSAIQWFVFIGLDLILRIAYVVGLSFNILLMPIALFLSILHCIVLGLAQLLIERLRPEIRRRAVVVALANALFVGTTVLLWIALVRDGSVTGCVNNKCDWVGGAITPDGVQTIFLQTSFQVILNLVSTAIALKFSSLFRRATRSAKS